MNMNKLAKEITLQEGGKKELSITDVKEVLKITLQELAKEEPVEVLKLLKKYEEVE